MTDQSTCDSDPDVKPYPTIPCGIVSYMANPQHLELILQGTKVCNEWRQTHPEMQVDLRDSDLTGLDLTEANLARADLSNATLNEAALNQANLSGANLFNSSLKWTEIRYANLEYADLSEANLDHANLQDTNLMGANLFEADLSEADFGRTQLSGASFRRAWCKDTIFRDTDLSAAVDLENILHYGPSTIDHRTLTRSGPLPLAFLRGCGLPDTLIEYLPSLLNQPIQFYSCFISYSTKDQAFADRLYADLQNKGVRCWFAPHDIQGGRKIHEQIDEAIRLYDRLLLILSPASLHSAWVETELAKARKRESQESRRMLFPVRLIDYEALRQWECFDADTGKDSAREIREYYIPDFSNWKDHDSYQQEFNKLLRDLKPDLKPAAAAPGGSRSQ